MTALVLFYWLKWILLLLMLYIYFFSTVAILPCSQNLLMYLLVRTGCCSGLIQLHNLHNHRSYICSFDVYELFDERSHDIEATAHASSQWISTHTFGFITLDVLQMCLCWTGRSVWQDKKREYCWWNHEVFQFFPPILNSLLVVLSIVYIDLWLFYILTNSLSAVDEMKKDRPCLT